MARVLVVDDEKLIVKGIRFSLEQDGFEVDCAYDGEEAIEKAKATEYDMVLLDVMLPKRDGIEVCQAIREFSEMPIIMLTAKGGDMDKILGLEYGADDYITKPFSLAVLRARVAAQLRRQAQSASVVTMGPFVFDFDRMDFRRAGVPVELSKTEQRLLQVLVINRGCTVPRAVLTERVWPEEAAYVEPNALSVAVKRLRAKLEADPANPQYLKTVYGLGYTWVVQP